MKVNLKFGGVNHTTENVRSRLLDTLVLGADLSHPGPGAIQGCPSIAAIVGSVDDDGGKYLGSMHLQTLEHSDRETLHFAEDMVTERLLVWQTAHGKLPTNIIYFRDGVSEGQYAKVKEVELGAIRSAYAKLSTADSTPTLKLTAIVAAKRHNTRFYSISQEDMQGRDKNCKPGTLVDDTITSPFFRDFYLQSHAGLQGTAKPTHYFILEDEIGMGARELQQFTHDTCYTYVRATLGVSYAAPAFYADRLCDRGRVYIRDFLSGEPSLKKSFNANKALVEQNLTAMRSAMFVRAPGTPKTDDERVFDVIEREGIAKACRKWTVDEVLKVWRDKKNENPWHQRVNGSMFWM